MLPCIPPTIGTTRKKVVQGIDANAPHDVEKRVLQIRQLLNDLGNTPRNADELLLLQRSKAVEAKEAIWQAELGEMIKLAPKQRDNIGSLFASLFGIKVRGIIDPTLTPSTAGAVRNRLLEAGRVGENQLQIAAKVEYARRVGDTMEGLQKSFDKLKLTKGTRDELINGAYTIGQIPRLRQTYGDTPGTQQLFNAMYQDFINLADTHGLSPQEVEQLIKAGEGVSSVFDEMRTIAAVHGLDITNSKHVEMLPWSPTKDFQWRMRDYDINQGLIRELETGEKTLADIWRGTADLNQYMPNDDVVASKILGFKSTDELQALLANPTEWRNYLHNRVSAEQLDTLVDSGVMSKLPMTGPQVFEYLVKQYDLPYKGLSDMFALDPKQAIDTYAQHLTKQTYEGAMFNDIAQNGLKGGWFVTGEMKRASKEFQEFVPISTLAKKHFEKFIGGTKETLQDAYVHPIVKKQLESLLDLSTSPAMLGNAAQVWNYLQPLFTKSVLLGSNTAYVGHIFMSNVIATMASGGHLLHTPSAFFDIFRSHKSLDHLDDVVKRFTFANGEKFTERQMLQKLMLHRNVDVTPLVGGQIGQRVDWSAINPKNAPGHLKALWDYTNSFGTPWSGERLTRSVGYEADQFMKQVDTFFKPMAAATQQMEMAFKWGTVKSLDVGKFKDFNSMLTHLDNYFYMYDDPGKLGGVINKYVQPFSSYLLQNTPSMVRFMLRSPQKFIAYNRLVALWNADKLDPNNPPPDGGFRASDMAKYPIILKHDPNSKEYITLFPKNYDPVMDAFTFLTESADNLQHIAFGHYTGNSETQRKQAMGEKGLQKTFNDMFDGSYWSGPVQVFTGYDPYLGEVPKDKVGMEESMVGFKVNKLTKALISLVPPLSSLDQKNPFDVFGRKEMKDASGKVIQEAKPGLPEVLGLPGAAPRSATDSGKLVENKGAVYSAMRTLGFNIKVVDTAINMQINLADIKSSIQDIRAQIVPAQKALAYELLKGKVSKDSDAYRRREADINKAIDTWLQLEFDSRRIQLWMAQNGIKEKNVMKELRDREIAASMLPMPGASEVQRLLKEARELRNQTGN